MTAMQKRSHKSRISLSRKVAVEIIDVCDAGRPDVVCFVPRRTGKPMFARRSDVDFAPGIALVKRWLAEKANL